MSSIQNVAFPSAQAISSPAKPLKGSAAFSLQLGEKEAVQGSKHSKINIYDRSIMRQRGFVSNSIFALLFREMVQYNQSRVDNLGDLERRLEECGFSIGQRMIEMVGCRERLTKRETKIVNMLQFITNVIWKHLFNKAADNLERSVENQDEYMIYEAEPVTNTFISVPEDMGSFNCASFVAGIIAGVLDSASFTSTVTAHAVNQEGGVGSAKTVCVYLIKFDAVEQQQQH